MNPSTRRQRGFTLVELLVVIGIIALLISALFPALTRAHDQSRTTACLSNLHQMGMAFIQYSNENQGWCVYSNDVEPPPGTTTNFPTAINSYLPYAGVQVTNGNNVYTCPSAINLNATNQFPLTYGLNCGAHIYRQLQGPGWTTFNPMMKLSSIMRPSEIVEMADTAQSSGAWTSGGWINGTPADNTVKSSTKWPLHGNADVSGGGYGIRYRHANNLAANILFFDGHAETAAMGSLKFKNLATGY